MASQWWRDNDDGPADRSPHFFKIILPNAVQEGKLRIPDKFVQKFGVDLSDMAFLIIPNGRKWKVKSEFASSHGVAVGHLLVFKYEGNSHFDVLIFDATATKIDYTLDDELQVHRIEDDESDDSSVEIIKHFYKGEGSGSAHPKKDGGVAENPAIVNAFKSENPFFTVIIRPSYVNGKDRASLPQDIINYLPREGFTKDYTKASILPVKLQIVDRLWPVKLYIYERSGGSSCVVSAGWFAFVRENSLRVGDICVFELIMRDGVVLNIHIFKCQD
ncbi:B3 domain-containing transcription factor VRN1-like [Quercus robur]|uniref:B3 domain-containing transcription factor VRN1-like n=1 Tax=Quercus robur TaxID=38942 RepID=UPI002163AEEA|nr:B3 domain-containing transcription factor VRN1-like [Quercus robur]